MFFPRGFLLKKVFKRTFSAFKVKAHATEVKRMKDENGSIQKEWKRLAKIVVDFFSNLLL